MITAVIPAYNEEKTIYEVVMIAKEHTNEVIVVDDASIDATAEFAARARARVIMNKRRKGYIEALKTGFRAAQGDIIVTLDADGEHNPRDIPLLVKPICDMKAELVLGKREKTARISEKFINWLVNRRVRLSDSCTGFRAIKRDLALELNLKGQCTCGILVLEAKYYGARVMEVPIETIRIDKVRPVAWYHIKQIFHVLSWLTKNKAFK